MKKEIPLFYPFIPKDEIMKRIGDSLDGKWIGQGKKVEQFEVAFGKMLKYKYPLFVNSGTSALELAYHMLDLKKGDEVIVPVLDCTAGQMGLLRRGVKIVFADVDDQLNISPASIASKITKKTKAVIGVHLGGIPFDKSIYPNLKKLGIPFIVDAAQHMAHCEGDFICYSFQAIKHISTCDGGMLVLNDAKTFKRAKLLRWFGIDRDLKAKKNFQAWKHRQMTFDITEPGFKMQPTDIDACFGLASLPYLPSIINHRRNLVREYFKLLPQEVVGFAGGSYWLMGIYAPQRDELAAFLLTQGIDNNLVHLRNDIFKVFGGKRLDLPNMNRLEKEYLYLPLNHKVEIKDVEYICKKIDEFYKKNQKA